MSGGFFMWNLLGINEEYHLIFSIISISLLVLLLVILYFRVARNKSKRTPKEKQVLIDQIYLEKLANALGNKGNIKNLTAEHQRLKVIVNDIKRVDSKQLSELSIPTFLKGKELTLLIKNHTKEVLSYLNDKIREEN
jgi:phosphotransferase system IIB component